MKSALSALATSPATATMTALVSAFDVTERDDNYGRLGRIGASRPVPDVVAFPDVS